MSTEQLKQWESDFGDAYTERNVVSWQSRRTAWQTMIGSLQLGNVVEIGPNRGHNLQTIANLNCVTGQIIGVEPNRKAAETAHARSPRIAVLLGNVFSLPFADNYADLTFTAGVLIHIALPDLAQAVREIYRISRRYILCIEYFAETETIIHYRGRENLLWKRDFKKHYLEYYPDLRLLNFGYWGQEQGFDRAHWWLFEK